MQWVQRQYAISQILRKQCVNKRFELAVFTHRTSVKPRAIL